MTLASIWTAFSQFDLILNTAGRLKLLQTSNGVPLGTVCETADGVVPLTSGGVYIESQITFTAGLATAGQIRISDQYGEMNLVAQGPLLALAVTDQPYTAFRLGGGVGEGPATWRVADVYLTDGVPTATPQPTKRGLVFNDSYLGNTHIDAFYPTADGTNLSVGNTPWVPDTGAVQYTQIDEHPPDEDASYIAADQSQQTSTFAFQSSRLVPFGRQGCAAWNQVYGVQWDGRARVLTDPSLVIPIVRQIVAGSIPGDLIGQGTGQVVSATAYRYYPDVFNRNPIDGEPWTFAPFFPVAVGAVGTLEFGARLS